MATVTVNFSTTEDDPFVLNKTYSTLKTKELNFRDTVDLTYPRLVIQYDSDLLDCNYAEIPLFNRFYFVKVKVLPSNSMLLEFSVDALKSNEAALKALPVTVVRTGSISKPTYVQDEYLPIEQSRTGNISTPYIFSSPHGNNTTLNYHVVLHTI